MRLVKIKDIRPTDNKKQMIVEFEDDEEDGYLVVKRDVKIGDTMVFHDGLKYLSKPKDNLVKIDFGKSHNLGNK